MSNSVTVNFPANNNGDLECVAHAAYYQRVTISQSGEQLGIFSGLGENVPMALEDGTQVLRLGPNTGSVQLDLIFEYSASGSGGPFSPAHVQSPVIETTDGFTFITVTSEDGVDSDDNDSYLTITYTDDKV